MEPSFSDGTPSVSSYTSFHYPEPRQQAASMTAFVRRETFSPLPPSFEQLQHHKTLADTSSFNPAVCTLSPRGQSSASTCGSDAGAHMAPHQSSQPRNQQVWPSPPLGPGDIQNCFSFQDSPASAGTYLPCYSNPSSSPADWSSPVSNFHRPSGLYQPQHPVDSQAYIRICTPTSSRDSPLPHPEMAAPYARSLHLDSASEAAVGLDSNLSQSPGLAPSFSAVPDPSSVGSPGGNRADTPASMTMPKDELAQDRPDEVFGGSRVTYDLNELDTVDSAKNDEPYAKLIYRAFMSQPGHSMTLQDIYKWFRENTSKTTNEKGGWQNSIRHNLSMNAAFTRRDRKQAELSATSSAIEGESPIAGEAKRTNEWVLEEWAVRDGVQSTTRYRKGNSGRRPARCTSHPNGVGPRPNQHTSTRALSGRKGGCAARNSRWRGQYSEQQNEERMMRRRAHPYRLIQQGLDSPPRSSMPGPYYTIPIPVPRLDPAAIQTPIAHGHDTIPSYGPQTTATEVFGVQMNGPQMDQAVPDGNDGHGGIHAMPSYVGHQEPMYLTPSPEFPYGIADVQLDYSSMPGGTDAPGRGRMLDPMHGSIGDWEHSQGM